MKQFLSYLLLTTAIALSQLHASKQNSIVPANNKPRNKIVYLISPPRCLSTAFLRMMESRGDFEVMQEPIFTDYRKLAPNEFGNKLLNKAAYSHVFVKDLSYAIGMTNFIKKNSCLLEQDNVHFIFLMRNPHHSIISTYTREPERDNPATFSKIVGYEYLHAIFMQIKKTAKNPPSIILAEDLYTHPEATNKALCALLKIPYKEQALHWDALDETFVGKQWNNVQSKKAMATWHSTVMKSTTIHTPTQYKTDAQGNPTFEEITTTIGKQSCLVAYHANMPFYQALLTEKQFILQLLQ